MSNPNNRPTLGACALGAVLTLLVALPAAAQGTPAQRAACTGDAMTLCSADVPDVDRIGACLRRQRALVSPACQQVMGLRGAATEVASTGSVRRRATP